MQTPPKIFASLESFLEPQAAPFQNGGGKVPTLGQVHQSGLTQKT